MQKFITALLVIVAVLILLAVGITFVLAPTSGNLEGPHTVNLTNNASGTTLHLHVGDEIRINLEENPSTGYRWNYTVPAAISVIEDRYIEPEGSTMVGQTGIHTWLLKVEQKGTNDLNWIYKRPWESTASDKTFIVHVVIE